jgi:hypothetical protein
MGRRRRPHDARVPELDRETPSEPGCLGEASRAAAPELVGVHGHLDAARATL